MVIHLFGPARGTWSSDRWGVVTLAPLTDQSPTYHRMLSRWRYTVLEFLSKRRQGVRVQLALRCYMGLLFTVEELHGVRVRWSLQRYSVTRIPNIFVFEGIPREEERRKAECADHGDKRLPTAAGQGYRVIPP